MANTALEILFATGFILIGTVTFQISYLVSGYNIYREMEEIEASFLSLAVGIIVFLFSPIGFIVIFSTTGESSPENISKIIGSILELKSLFAFFSFSIGLGLIFGFSTMLNIRWNLMRWIREKTNVPFWIISYIYLWDDFLNTIKKGGKISIQTKSSRRLNGFLQSYSIRKEPKEIQIKSCLTGKEILISGDEIKSIEVDERFFKKHQEYINHIGQAACCIIIGVGIFLLANNARIMLYYISLYKIDILKDFYNGFFDIFFYLSISLLIISVWIERKDFNSKRATFMFCSDVPLSALSLIILFFSLKYISEYFLIMLVLVAFLFFIIRALVYKYLESPFNILIGKFINDPDLKTEIEKEIKSEENLEENVVVPEDQKNIKIYNYLNDVLGDLYLNICLNEKSKSDLNSNANKVDVFDASNCKDGIRGCVARKMNEELGILKFQNKYNFLKNEDANTFWFLKNKIVKPKLNSLYKK